MAVAAKTRVELPEAVSIPGVLEPVTLRLPTEIAALRREALAFHQSKGPVGTPVPELALIDARSWAAHSEEEDWLIWRARRCAERLKAMPLDLEPGERLAGKPRFRDPLESEQTILDDARCTLASMPPFPGGDAGHFHPDYDKLFHLGVGGILDEITSRRQQAQGDRGKEVFYDACQIALEGMAAFIGRVARACQEMAAIDEASEARWSELAAICRHMATEPPRTFHEALQLMFMTIIALWFGEDHGLSTPGRMDQTLWPFYEADLAAGRITRQGALELIACLYIQLNRILHTGSAISVMVGGRAAGGRDVTNELTYLCLLARLATGLGYPTVGLAWHRGTPSELMDWAVQMLAYGRGDPAFFNDEVIVQGLRDHGVSPADSYNYMNSTCVEIKVVGCSNMWVTAPYINLPQSLLEVMDAAARGSRPAPSSFAALQECVRANLESKIREAAQRLDNIWHQRAVHGCFPLASCLVHDCLERGLDFDRGGARYNWVENSFVGLANLVDSLMAIRTLVFEQQELALAELTTILHQDFRGHEALRQRILNALPHYGSDLDEPDELARAWAEFLIETTGAQTIGPHRYVPGFFCWIMHERLGRETGATPDGRHAGWPLADAAGAAQGREKRGPTASALSTTRWPHRAALGGLVHNAKFSSSVFAAPGSRASLRQLIEIYLQRGGFEMQVNVVSRETLLAAREQPEQYQDLLVRVAGYSDYFVKLNDKMQEEILARTEHDL
jgi:pyruvate-formate lyase